MSIKFKCGCGHVLSVPESMAGKQGKCPKCQKPLKVPTPKTSPSAMASTAQSASSPPRKQEKTPAAASPTNSGLDGLFDDAGLVQKKGPTCSKCGAAIKPGAKVCTSCGLNFETGEQLAGFALKQELPEFKNIFLQEAADNMRRDDVMELRRDKAAMPWWVIMSFLIGAVTLCAAGVVIVDGKFGTPADESTFFGKVQRLPVFTVLGMTSGITGIAITIFAHLSICAFAFSRSILQGIGCFILPLLFSFFYGIKHWADNKAAVKAIITAACFIGFGSFLIVQGGGFGLIQAVF